MYEFCFFWKKTAGEKKEKHVTSYNRVTKENNDAYWLQFAVADPGFPVGGRRPRGGGGVADSQGGYVLKILYVVSKQKNLDP